jgi:hypothetical protein
MIRRSLVALLGLVALGGSALAHHGWGNYDAKNPLTVTGKILTSKYENPHVVLTVQAPEKVWTVTLAPTSRMQNRGALIDLVAVGRDISAFGYPSTVDKDEIRAERITVDGKTIEMR